ncbi:hypothetical protein ACXY7D_11995 [Sphingomonas melonis]
MIRTVSDLKRALDAFPDDLPFDPDGFVIDNGGTRNAILTLDTYDLPPSSGFDVEIAQATAVGCDHPDFDFHDLDGVVWTTPGGDHD